jgi:hypothetical protein
MMLDDQDHSMLWLTVMLLWLLQQSRQLRWAQAKTHWWKEKLMTQILSDPVGK